MATTGFLRAVMVSVSGVLVAAGCSKNSDTTGPENNPPPQASAYILSDTNGWFGLGARVTEFVFIDSAHVPDSTATVKINGTVLPYVSSDGAYEGTAKIAAGAAVQLQINSTNGSSGNMTSAMPTAFPTIATPASGTTWQEANANTLTWGAGAPTTGTGYTIFISPVDSSNHLSTCVDVASTATSYTISANALNFFPPGAYHMSVAMMATPNYCGHAQGVPITGLAAGSVAYILGVSPEIGLTLQ